MIVGQFGFYQREGEEQLAAKLLCRRVGRNCCRGQGYARNSGESFAVLQQLSTSYGIKLFNSVF